MSPEGGSMPDCEGLGLPSPGGDCPRKTDCGWVNAVRTVARAMGVVPAVLVEGTPEAVDDDAPLLGAAAASGAYLMGVREGLADMLCMCECGCLGEGGGLRTVDD